MEGEGGGGWQVYDHSFFKVENSATLLNYIWAQYDMKCVGEHWSTTKYC